MMHDHNNGFALTLPQLLRLTVGLLLGMTFLCWCFPWGESASGFRLTSDPVVLAAFGGGGWCLWRDRGRRRERLLLELCLLAVAGLTLGHYLTGTAVETGGNSYGMTAAMLSVAGFALAQPLLLRELEQN